MRMRKLLLPSSSSLRWSNSNIPTAPFTCHQCRRNRSVHTMRSYEEAIHHLNLLTSNRQTTLLFQGQGKHDVPAGNPNAHAIPEMLSWLSRAGYTPSSLKPLRTIHVAGTKGKGSVSAYATSLLKQYCKKGSVGTYMSPHLVTPRERILIDGEMISKAEFAEGFWELWDRFTESAVSDDSVSNEQAEEAAATKPFFFRYLTILAWHIFLKRGVENVVLECGIGGEYDATNVIPAEAVSATVVTQLGIDHVAMLGGTMEEIAWHKAGIFKPKVTGFTRYLDSHPRVMDVLRARTTEKGGQLVELRDDVVEQWGGVRGSLMGAYQKYNQALAVLAVQEHLAQTAHSPESLFERLPEEMEKGLQTATIRGRSEVLEKDGVTWLLDGAHTRESLDEVARWLVSLLKPKERVILLFNQQERNAAVLLSGLLQKVANLSGRQDVFGHAIFTRSEYEAPTAGEAVDLTVQEEARKAMQHNEGESCETEIYDCVALSSKAAVDVARNKGMSILVTGSMHLVGGVLRAIEHEETGVA